MKIQNETLSLINATKKINNYKSNPLKKGMKKLQEQSAEIVFPLIEKNIDKPFTSKNMYINHALISYSRDADLFNNISNMTLKDLEKFLKNKDNNIVNYDSFFDNSDTKRLVPVPYGGGKQNHKYKQQSLVSAILLSNPQIDSYYEMFVGGFGSVYNSLPLLLKHGIKNIFLSDINKSLINMYRQIQKKPKQVQRHLASIDLEYFQLFGNYHPETKEEGKEWFNYLFSEFEKLEKLNRMTPRRAALYMYLSSNTQGGMLAYNMKTKRNKLTFSFSANKLKNIPLMINKVEIFHKIFNLANITFSVKNYVAVHNRIKDMDTALVLHDSPYAKFTHIKTEVMENCSYNYGVKFKQEPLLNKIQTAKYPVIYYNNHNPAIEEFSKINEFHYKKMDVEYANGKERTKSIEILMYSDRNNVNIPTNNTNYKPLQQVL